MKYILVPHPEVVRQLPFYFAVEEYVARHYTDDEYFMVWRVAPTVMLGRNQLIENEVNVDYCRRHDIDVFRRKSGGGCIYADLGCLQFSYISSHNNINEVFVQYMSKVADMLVGIGIPASLSGRNDIIVNAQKVAGSAFYGMKERCVLHNSLLFDTHLDHLAEALTPSQDKLQSKGVSSVRQRVTNIAAMTDLTVTAFMDYARHFMCGKDVLSLSADDMKAVAEIERELASDAFVYGKNPKYTLQKTLRIEGVGIIEAHIELKNDTIVNINLMGDYFLLSDIDNQLLLPLRGIPFTREAVEERLRDVSLNTIIRNLELRPFLRLLFGRRPHVMKPDWLKIDLVTRDDAGETAEIIHHNRMNTICTSGLCPNRAECWAARTATLMIGGEVCTRKCRFCNTLTGKPAALDPGEPMRVADTVKSLNLRYAVLTSVDRDDLPDYGAAHWVKTVEAVKEWCPDTRIELLIPDFMGRDDFILQVLATRPAVVGHNMETVRRLTPSVRSVARYDRSLHVLQTISQAGVEAKTGFMVGMGETREEIDELMDDVLVTGCRRLTIGQYLQPTAHHLPVVRYVSPDEFVEFKRVALAKGFKHVESGPLVRSSYHAEHVAAE